MKNLPWIFCFGTVICIGTLAGHSYIYQQNQIEVLKANLSLSDKAREIDADQIRDLLHINQQLNLEKDAFTAQAYVSGALSVLDNKEHIEKIWHNGYDRGTEVQNLAYKSERDAIAIEKLKDELNLRSPLEDLEKK
jgi:hypothetical protein